MFHLPSKLQAQTVKNSCKSTGKGLRLKWTTQCLLLAYVIHHYHNALGFKVVNFIKEDFVEKNWSCSFKILLINNCKSYWFQTMDDDSFEKIFNKPFQMQAIMRKSFCPGPINFLSWNHAEYINIGSGRGKTPCRIHFSSCLWPYIFVGFTLYASLSNFSS